MDKADAIDVIMENIEKEFDSIARAGISQSNLDIAWKLTEIYYRLMLVKKSEKHECDCDAEYLSAKRLYRKHSCEETKTGVIKCLNAKMNSIQSEIEELWKDADFLEERKAIEGRGWM